MSPENNTVYNFYETLYRSLTSNINSRGPNIDPWGLTFCVNILCSVV